MEESRLLHPASKTPTNNTHAITGRLASFRLVVISLLSDQFLLYHHSHAARARNIFHASHY
jgi:hypothetical protein